MDIFVDILFGPVASAILLVIFKVWMTRNLEKYKNELKKDSFKTQRLYDRRIDGIIEMHEKLQTLHNLLVGYTMHPILHGNKINVNDFREAFSNCFNSFRKNRILIPKETDRQIEFIMEKIKITAALSSQEDELTLKKLEALLQRGEEIKSLFILLDESRENLRRLLGVEIENVPIV